MTFKAFAADLVMVAHNASPPSEPEWAAFLDLMEAMVIASGRVPHTLVWSTGGAPSTSQRAASKTRVSDRGDRTERIAVMTPSAVVRGAVTILRWLTRSQFHSFGPSALPEAIRYLGVAHPVEAVAVELETLKRALR